MGKKTKKAIEQSDIRKGGCRVYSGKDSRKRYLLSLEWKRVGVTESDSGDDGTDELREFN